MAAKQQLEEEIMNCWNIVTDLNQISSHILDGDQFTDMSGEHQDKIANLLIGMHELYEIKFQRLFATYEKMLKEEHKKS